MGCRLNFFESEIINGILSNEKHAKKIVVNTCAVTNNAVQKSLQEVRKLAKHHPDKEIIVTGCASQVEKGLFSNLKNVSRIIDNKYKTVPDAYEFENNLSKKKYEFPELRIQNQKEPALQSKFSKDVITDVLFVLFLMEEEIH